MSTEAEKARETDDQVVELAKYTAEAARWEIGRTGQGASALLSALSFVGTVTGAGFAVLAKQGGSPLAATVIAVAAVLLMAAFLGIVLSIRPRLPRPGKPATGWPMLLDVQRGPELERFFQKAAQAAAEFYAADAHTLARIAVTKHRWIRKATTCVLVGFPIGVFGGLVYALGW
ncbi:Pycsar system effector family protein [Saccharopolyspora taberi]|uniref:Pycsar system effector family protein n=1 Tax=Saccharopolyspora taberi TaxID=60895 RepID=UPI0031D65F39